MKKFLVLLILILIILFQSSCWDYKEINELKFVSGIGLDIPENGSGVKVTLELVTVSSDKGDKLESKLFINEDESIFKAIDGLRKHSPGAVDLSHCDLIVMSEDYAKRGVKELTQFMLETKKISKSLILGICDGVYAYEFLNTKEETEPVSSLAAAKLVKEHSNTVPGIVRGSFFDSYLSLDGSKQNLTRFYLEGEEKRLMSDGYGLIENGKLLRFVKEEENG